MSSPFEVFEGAAEALLTDLVRLSFEVAALAALVALAIWILRIRSPAARHALWLLVLLKPLVWLFLSSPWTLFSLLPDGAAVLTPEALTSSTTSHELAATTAPRSLQGLSEERGHDPNDPMTSLAVWVVLAWVAGTLAMVTRLLAGIGATGHLRRITQPLSEGPVAQACLVAASRMGTSVPQVALTSATESPLATGIFRPVILIPHRLADSITPEQLQLILMHEIAHIRRFDNLVLLVRRLVEAILFFHPAIWMCTRQLHIEAESACDDAVLAASGEPVRYADGLARVAESITQPKGVPAMNLLAATETRLGARVRRILESPPAATRLSRTISIAVLTSLAVACLPSTAASPGPHAATEAPASGAQSAAAVDTFHVSGDLADLTRLVQGTLMTIYPEATDSLLRADARDEALARIRDGAPAEVVLGLLRSRPSHPATVYYYRSSSLEKVTTNPAGTNAQRFVAASLQLGIADRSGAMLQPREMERIRHILEPFDGLARSVVMDVLGSSTIDELEDRERLSVVIGQRLTDEVIGSHLRLAGRSLAIHDIIFTDFVIQ